MSRLQGNGYYGVTGSDKPAHFKNSTKSFTWGNVVTNMETLLACTVHCTSLHILEFSLSLELGKIFQPNMENLPALQGSP